MKRIIMDLDDTICQTLNGDYINAKPIYTVIEKMHEYKKNGFEIAINTSRNMRTYQGNTGKITANTLPIILKWLEQHSVPYDEIYIGKPWCGMEGFYVDDRSIRPNEFVNLTFEQIQNLIGPLDMEEYR